MGIGEVIIAPRSPWQNPYAARYIGSVRSECLGHVVVPSEPHMPVMPTILAPHEVCTRARERTDTTYTANPSSIYSSNRRSM